MWTLDPHMGKGTQWTGKTPEGMNVVWLPVWNWVRVDISSYILFSSATSSHLVPHIIILLLQLANSQSFVIQWHRWICFKIASYRKTLNFLPWHILNYISKLTIKWLLQSGLCPVPKIVWGLKIHALCQKEFTTFSVEAFNLHLKVRESRLMVKANLFKYNFTLVS